MSKGMIGRKLGMTAVFDEAGNHIPCTVVEANPNVVTQVKTVETDGYAATQVGYADRKEKHTTKAQKGHFDKAATAAKRVVVEFDGFGEDLAAGDELRIEDVFSEGERIDVAGTSKGKGFQGVVKRHGFAGVGMATHGQHNRQRAPGSIGASSWPSRVFKGMRMGGQTGNKRITIKNLRVVRVLSDQNLLLIEGAVPGGRNGFLELRKKQ